MKKFKFSAVVVGFCFIAPIEAEAVDPVTAGLVIEGINFVTSALEKPQPNLTLEVVQRNRALLITMNGKLDQLGANLIKLHAAVGDIPDKLADELDKERLYQLGSEAGARGLSLLQYIEDFESDLKLYAENPDLLNDTRDEYYSRLNVMEQGATLLSNKILQEPSIRNIDAMTQVLVAHAHLSILAETFVRFNRRQSRLEGAARSYSKQLDTILLNVPDTLTGWTYARFASLPDNADWSRLNREFNLPMLVWAGPGNLPLADFKERLFEQCIIRRNQRETTDFRPAIPNAGEPAHNFTYKETLSEDYFIRRLTFSTGPKQSLASSIITESTQKDCSQGRATISVGTVVEDVFNNLGPKLEILRTSISTHPPEDCLTACHLAEQQSALTGVMNQIHAISASTRILAIVHQLKDDVLAIREGDLSSFQVSDTLESQIIYRDAIRELVDESEKLSRQQEVAALEDERLALAQEVEELIRQQDTELSVLFKEAAEAAEFNKTLGYIKMAAKIYEGWAKLDAYLTKGEKEATTKSVKDTRDGLVAAQSREPANAAILEPAVKLVNNLLGLTDYYGDLARAAQAQEQFDEIYTQTLNSIPAGAEQSFDVYVSKSDPFAFRFLAPAGEPSIHNADSTFLGTVKLKGIGRGTERSLDVHMEVITD